MIDKAEFSAGMGLLAGAFNRTVDPAISRVYYGVLSAKLTTEEFQRAVSLALSTETFWPSPAVLLGKVKADDETRGLAVLEHVRRVMWRAGGHRFLPFETFQREFDEPTRAAIAKVGGLAEISDNDSKSLAKSFATAYSEAINPRPALPSSPPVETAVKQLVTSTARNLSLTSGRDRAAGERP